MTEQQKRKSSLGLIVLAFAAFISLGLPDGLLGVAWPSISGYFSLPLDAVGILLVAATAGYMFSSFFSGAILRRLGVGGLLAASCGLTSLSLVGYTIAPYWWWMPVCAVFLGLGAGAIDAGLNTYIARNHSEQLMQWLHASFGVGITLGPLIMTLGLRLTGNWKPGYRVVAAAQILLALIFLFTRGSWKKAAASGKEEAEEEIPEAPMKDTLKVFAAYLSVLMFFLYTGLELGLGLWAYSILTKARGVDPVLAGYITGAYWGTFTLGRILAGWSTKRIKGVVLLLGAMTLAGIGILLVLLNLGPLVTVVGISLTGFALAPIFPGLVSDTENRVGRTHQANTIGMQISAAGLGAAVVPSIAGVLARNYGLEVIPLYMLVCLGLLLSSFVFTHVHGKKER